MNKYLGLLRWSLKYQDGTQDTAKPMDEERRNWLLEAIESQMVDPVEEMINLIKILKIERVDEPAEGEGSEDFSEETFIENKSEALDGLIEYVENVDMVRDFNKNGGVDLVLNLIEDKAGAIRYKAIEILGIVTQNHPEMQQVVMNKQGLDMLMKRWKAENCTDKERVKLIFAVSCLIRGSSQGTKQFIQVHKGVALLLEALTYCSGDDKDDQKLRLMRKVLFLLRYLLNAVPAIRAVLSTTLVKQLSNIITHEDVDTRENALHLILTVFQDSNATERLEKGEWYNEFTNKIKNYSVIMKLPSDDVAVEIAMLIAKLVSGDTPSSKSTDETLFAEYVKPKPMKMTNKDGNIGLDLGTSGT